VNGLALEVDGWPPEPCDTAAPAPPIRGSHPYASLADEDEPRAYRRTVTVGSVDDYQPLDRPTA
jgi:hypothetical protein